MRRPFFIVLADWWFPDILRTMGDDKSTSEEKRKAHMQRRRDQGLSVRELGKEFKTSHSTAHRKTTAKKPGLNLRKGVIDMGSAK